jgi:type 1 glutamine amidotransferase
MLDVGCWMFSSISTRRSSLAATLLAVVSLLSVGHLCAAPAASPGKARILLVTGEDYPGHHWRETAPVLAAALQKDPRLEVFIVEDPDFLDSAAINKYDLILLHFQNWQQPGPGERARENLRQFVAGGKGVALVHFACGAWFGEWPEFAEIAGRVWAGPGPNVRQHDPYGPFRVELLNPDHTILRGMTDFDTHDELYTCLVGDHPIEVLAQAKSKVDGKYYPMAFSSHYGKGRTFHCVFGHDVKALSVPQVQELYRRGCAWAAGLAQVARAGAK